MQTMENLAQVIEDVKTEVVKDVFKKEKTANVEELLDVILLHKMSNLRAKCPRSEWPLVKLKILLFLFSLGPTIVLIREN